MLLRPGQPQQEACLLPFCQQLYGCHVHPHGPTLLPRLPHELCEDVELDHLDTCNKLAGTHLCHCICHATLQYMNDDLNQHREYTRSCLIPPCGAQYKERLFPKILEPWNHWEPLTNSTTKEPFPMELVGDFRSMD